MVQERPTVHTWKEYPVDDEDIQALMPYYFNARWNDIALLRQLVAQGELKQVARLGHSMRGSGATYGVLEVCGLGERLQEAALQHNSALLLLLVQELEDFLQSLKHT